MGIEDSEDMGLNFPSSGMNTDSVSVWDPIVSLSQNGNFEGSSLFARSDFPNSNYLDGIGNRGMVPYQSDSSLVEMVPKLPCFGNGSFPEMVGSFGLAECGQINSMGCSQDYKVEQVVSEELGKGKSPCGKGKKRGSESSSPPSPSLGDQRKEMSEDSPDYPIEQDKKRQKVEHNMGANLRGKQTCKLAKDSSNNDDGAKGTYIHVRARRGQATNSHSLAERVRRERISERMKLLQELVPGCNKITGKAVMLDEIINYVQSLQQQVEFLSMKLATVNPELNIDIDQILSKEIVQSRGGNVSIPGFCPGITPSNPYPPIIPQGPLPSLSNTSPFHQMQQNMWENEIQSLLQMGLDSSHPINNLEPRGRSKLGL